MIAKKQRMFIGGKWVDSVTGETFDDLNPYTGEVYAQVSAGTREDVRQAIDTAKGVRMVSNAPLIVVPTVASNDSPTNAS
jgi:acyl-CoA reductase-like NAD-dependent aldehyde dehydrogenase